MKDRSEMNLEKLKESFPSLDSHSAKRLLGGTGTGPTFESTLTFEFFGPGGDPNTPIFTISGNGSSGGQTSVSGGGSDYFGLNEVALVHSDDFGWGGWGDGGPGDDHGYGSNPGGYSGEGQEQDNSNQDVHQTAPMSVENNFSFTSRAYELINNSSARIWVLRSGTDEAFPVMPGGTFPHSIDGVRVNGIVYKFTNGYGYIEVTDTVFHTNYWVPGLWEYFILNGGILNSPPPQENWWWDLFDAPLP